MQPISQRQQSNCKFKVKSQLLTVGDNPKAIKSKTLNLYESENIIFHITTTSCKIVTRFEGSVPVGILKNILI